MLTDTLTEEILAAALNETEFAYQEESYNLLFSFVLAHQHSVAKRQMHCLAIKKLFASRKMSIDSLMDAIQPLVLENKRFDSQENSKTLALSGFFRSPKFLTLETFP